MEPVTAAEYENVNGFKLSLKVDESGPKSITFTITYKSNKIKCRWSRFIMILTLILYAGSFVYAYMTMKSVLVCAIITFVLAIFWAKRTVKSESLTLVPTVGLQSSVKYIIGQEERFVPWSNIDDVIINEVIKMNRNPLIEIYMEKNLFIFITLFGEDMLSIITNRVLYFLSVLVKRRSAPDSDLAYSVLTLFQYTKPRLQMIEKIYSDITQTIAQQLENCEAKTAARKQTLEKDSLNKNAKCKDHGDEVVDRTFSGEIHEDIG